MTLRSYAEAVAVLAVILTPIAFASAAARRRLAPELLGAFARLADSIVALSMLTVVSEALGSVGWFRRGPLMIAALVSGAALWKVARRGEARRPAPRVAHAEEHPRWARAGAAVIATAVMIQWTVLSRSAFDTGVISVDSRQYHLPFAADFTQTGWLSRFYFLWIDPTWTFYPANSDLLHAVGMLALGNDTLSVPMNLGWLALALLAGWCVGQPRGVGHLTLAATAVLVSAPGFAAGQAASALNDITLLALVLAMLAFLLRGGRRRGPLALAGLAAGLAVGTKYTAIAPVAAASVVVFVRAGSGRRARAMTAWLGACTLTGGFWYARNIVRIGNPVPQVIPLLPRPRFPALEAYGGRIIDYTTDGSFWRDVVPDGLRSSLGPAWVGLIGLGAVAVVLGVIAILRRDGRDPRTLSLALSRWQWALLVSTTVFAGGAYVASDGSAFGPPGTPFQFALNVRYGMPAFCIALVAFALGAGARWRAPLFGLFAVGIVVNMADAYVGESVLRSGTTWALAGVAIGVVAIAWLAVNVVPPGVRSSRRVIAVVAAGALVVGLGIGRKVETHYLAGRYTTIPVGNWARSVQHARIGVVGLPAQYPLFGLDLSNHVDYIGQREPHGGFRSITDCNAFRAAVVDGRYDYVVAGTAKWLLEPALEKDWLASDPGAIDQHVAGSNVTGSDVLGVYRIEAGKFAVPCP